MRHSTVLKSLVILVGVIAVGGGVVLGLRVTPEVPGDTEMPQGDGSEEVVVALVGV